MFPLYMIGNSAYPMQTWLMKPFAHNSELTSHQQNYNYRICRARIVVENAFRHVGVVYLKGMICTLITFPMLLLQHVCSTMYVRFTTSTSMMLGFTTVKVSMINLQLWQPEILQLDRHMPLEMHWIAISKVTSNFVWCICTYVNTHYHNNRACTNNNKSIKLSLHCWYV